MEIVNKMRDPKTGVAIQDRRWIFTTYPKCFVGREAVDWFIKNNFVDSKKDAVELGNVLFKHKFFHHVTRGMKFLLKKIFLINFL